MYFTKLTIKHRFFKNLFFGSLLISTFASVVGCGQKGALILPEDAKERQQTQQQKKTSP